MDSEGFGRAESSAMRRWLRRLTIGFALLAVLLLTAALWAGRRYSLDFGSALQRALRATPTFTIDPRRLSDARFARVLFLGYVHNRRANEISGLSLSRRHSGLIWTINDSGDGPFLYAIGEDGRDHGIVRVRGALNVDWEDLAGFELDGVSYLLIADVGDNLAWRPAVTLYVVPEPELQGERFGDGAFVDPTWVLRVRYQGGPEDCEAVAVDARTRRVLLLSKRTVPPVLYALDLEPRRFDPRAVHGLLVARTLAKVPGIPQPSAEDRAIDPEFGFASARPTAMDVSTDGTRAVVFTYKEGYLFERAPGEGWAQAFAHTPRRVRTPYVKAMEAGAFAADGRTLYMTSEFLPTPIFRFEP